MAPDGFFKWQAGYGAFSLSRSHLRVAVTYVLSQEERHAHNKLWDEWEQAREEIPIEGEPAPS